MIKSFSSYGLPHEYVSVLNWFFEDVAHIVGPKLQLFVLAGSCGLGGCIPGWSDIDILMVVESLHFSEIRKLHEAQQKYNIKIASTILTRYEYEHRMFDGKTKVILFQLIENMLHLNFFKRSAGIALPVVSLEDVQKDDELLLPSYLHKLKRELQSGEPDKRTLIKMLYLVIKIKLRSRGHGVIATSYRGAFAAFAQRFGYENFDILAEIQSETASEEFVGFARTVVEDICNGEI